VFEADDGLTSDIAPRLKSAQQQTSLQSSKLFAMVQARCRQFGRRNPGEPGARVAALAGASEVLVSSTVKDLVAGSGLRFGDRGTRSLKGIPGEWHIFTAER
jgi:hypothetical protein